MTRLPEPVHYYVNARAVLCEARPTLSTYATENGSEVTCPRCRELLRDRPPLDEDDPWN